MIARPRSARDRDAAQLACGIATVALIWALSGTCAVRAQANGVPNEQTLEEALRKKPVTPKPPPNSAPAKKVADTTNVLPPPPKPARRGVLIPMVVVSDAVCTLEVNGDSIAPLEPGAVKKLSVFPGDQLIKCASTEEPGEVYSVVQNIKAGEQSVLQIALASRIEAAGRKREALAQSLVAENELWTQASQSGAPADLQAYLDKYSNGKFVVQAKGLLAESTQRAQKDAEAAQQRMDIVRQLPARPILPFPIDEKIWENLESSSFYRDLPRRSHKIIVQISSQILNESVKGASANWSQATTKEIVPFGDKCVLLHTATHKSEPGDAPAEVVDNYQCGPLKLESVNSGKLVGVVSLSDAESFIQSDKAQREKPPCEFPSSSPAKAFHASLTGTATRYGCSTGDYYFEDLSVWLYELGEMDAQKQQYVVPTPGYHFESVADGGSGGKFTTTYQAFSWTDSN